MNYYYLEGFHNPLFAYEDNYLQNNTQVYTGVTNFLTFKSRKNASIVIDETGHLTYYYDDIVLYETNLNDKTEYDLIRVKGDSETIYKKYSPYPFFRYERTYTIEDTDVYRGVLPLINGIPFNGEHYTVYKKQSNDSFQFINTQGNMRISNSEIKNYLNSIRTPEHLNRPHVFITNKYLPILGYSEDEMLVDGDRRFIDVYLNIDNGGEHYFSEATINEEQNLLYCFNDSTGEGQMINLENVDVDDLCLLHPRNVYLSNDEPVFTYTNKERRTSNTRIFYDVVWFDGYTNYPNGVDVIVSDIDGKFLITTGE